VDAPTRDGHKYPINRVSDLAANALVGARQRREGHCRHLLAGSIGVTQGCSACTLVHLASPVIW
jgi:hypothetical protein